MTIILSMVSERKSSFSCSLPVSILHLVLHLHVKGLKSFPSLKNYFNT